MIGSRFGRWLFAARMWPLLPDSPKICPGTTTRNRCSSGEWRCKTQRQRLRPITATALARQLDHVEEPILLHQWGSAKDTALRLDDSLEMCDPRHGVRSGVELVWTASERLPPILWKTPRAYNDLPWLQLSVCQLKRTADLLVAALLLLTVFVFIAAILIGLKIADLFFMPRSAVAGWGGRSLFTSCALWQFSL